MGNFTAHFDVMGAFVKNVIKKRLHIHKMRATLKQCEGVFKLHMTIVQASPP